MPYNLHRSGDKAEWADTPHAERNIWQKVAAWSHGILTLANVATALGVVLVHEGLKDFEQGDRQKGILKIAAGHGCDWVDGFLANLNGTKSPLGEFGDAFADKIKTADELESLSSAGAIPVFATRVIATHGLSMALLTGVARLRGVRTHAILPGKIATGSFAAAIIGYASSTAAQESELSGDSTRLSRTGHFALGLAAVNGGAGVISMANAAFAPRTTENSL